MKKKWKSGKQQPIGNWQLARSVNPFVGRLFSFVFFLLLVFLTSCKGREEGNPVSSTASGDLDELAQPANQTILSDAKSVLPLRGTVFPMLTATGVITYDPRLLHTISARYSGRIEKLYVRFNFENITRGQRIMDIYSPEILTAQQNLISLLNHGAADSLLIKSSEDKLRLLGLTAGQLTQIETTLRPINPLPVYSDWNGHIHDIGITNGTKGASPAGTGMSPAMNNPASPVIQEQIENLPSSQSSALSIKEGMYIQSGQALFAIYNIDRVWAVLNIFPRDAALVREGDRVTLVSETNPLNIISSTISYMEPVTGQNALTIKARVYLQNAENLHLKIGTLLTAKIASHGVSGLWLPRTAVVNLGKRQLVYLKTGKNFTARNIQAGFETDSTIQVIAGLKENDWVAVHAQYMVDSESFIQTRENEQK